MAVSLALYISIVIFNLVGVTYPRKNMTEALSSQKKNEHMNISTQLRIISKRFVDPWSIFSDACRISSFCSKGTFSKERVFILIYSLDMLIKNSVVSSFIITT